MLTSNSLFSFGTMLKTFRKRYHFSQERLAKVIGVHRHTIERWEEGDFLPKTKGIVLEIAKYLRLNDQEARQLLEASFTALAPLWSVPLSRNAFFTGRETILEGLYTQLRSREAVALTQSSALHGLGGVGKTQIALEYAYRRALEYSAVFWIIAETEERIIASFSRIAEALQLPGQDDKNQQWVVTLVQHWLSTHNHWLLIWDNMEDLELLDRFLPSFRSGAILITTRSQMLGTFAQGVDLLPMKPEEGILFLLRCAKVLAPEATSEHVQQFAARSHDQYTAAEDLVAALGGLPLALDQAGAYIEETGCSLSGYLERYKQQQFPLLDRRGNWRKDHPQSVIATFRLSIERVKHDQRTATAANLLCVCAFLHAEAIPEELFVEGAPYLGPELEPLGSDLAQLDQTIIVLRSFSLVQRQAATLTLSLHRLVQVVLREQMDEHEQTTYLRRAITALNQLFPEVTHEEWRRCERLLPHILACASITPASVGNQDLANVLRKAADYLREHAQYEQAERAYQQSLHIGKQVLGEEHTDVASSLVGLAILYTEQGKHEQAEAFYQRALHIRKQVFGLEHPEVANLLSRLANLSYRQGRYEQAEATYQQALHIQEQISGLEHPLVAQALCGLAYLYIKQGKYEQAEALFRQALHIRKQTLGAVHPDLAISLNGLAILYQEQGKYEQAEPLLQQALHLWEQTLGSDHPQLAAPTYSLALTYGEQGKYEQAEPLYRQALHLWEQAFGPEHQNLASPLNGLANLYLSQGKLEEVEALCKRALSIWEKALGSEHPNLGYPLDTLASLYYAQGKYKQAEPLYQQILHLWEQRFGPEYPHLAIVLNGQAKLYLAQGKDKQAGEIYQRALHIQEQSLGQYHPETARTLYDLAIFWQGQGNPGKALSLAERALLIRSQLLESIHPQMIATQALYAQLLQEQTCTQKAAVPRLHAEEILDLCDGEHQAQHTRLLSYKGIDDSVFENDSLQEFLDTCCEFHPRAWSRASDLWQAYEHWVKEHQERFALSRKAFIAQLKVHGCFADRTKTARIWRGITLVEKHGDGG